MTRVLFFSTLLVSALFTLVSSPARSQSTLDRRTGHYPKKPTTTSVISVAPNPFTVKTTIRYRVQTSGHLTITVLDVSGREAAVVLDEQVAAGLHDVSILGSSLSSPGTYYCKLTWGSEAPVTVNLSYQN